MRSIGLDARLHPDFASKTYGIPFKVVAKSQKRVPIHFTDYGDESDKGPYPIPASRAGRGRLGPSCHRPSARDVHVV